MYPVLISYGPIEIYTYGVFLALAFYFSVQWAVRIGTRRGFDEEMILNLAVVSILSAILGARSAYVYVYWDQFFADRYWDIFKVWQGGLVFYGGLIGGVCGGITYWWLKRMSILAMLDVAVMSVSLGHAIGRVGCFFYGCCYGKIVPIGSAWLSLGHQFPHLDGIRYPVQIMASVGNALIFILLIFVLQRAKKPATITIIYCYIYSLFRFTIELFRDDPRGTILGVTHLSTSQTISVVILCTGICLHTYMAFGPGKRLKLPCDENKV
tara:strand:+ start:11694 stop:12494 length:801 start_codon:yes stop_codon:yes gene_type:complete